ncbi:MAG: hypothetical protein IPJ88_06310 [Myxococcales bacterium]|nr:MAG: hypothetical protein IPJ88_06310 [Myxococcales bacterium]
MITTAFASQGCGVSAPPLSKNDEAQEARTQTCGNLGKALGYVDDQLRCYRRTDPNSDQCDPLWVDGRTETASDGTGVVKNEKWVCDTYNSKQPPNAEWSFITNGETYVDGNLECDICLGYSQEKPITLEATCDDNNYTTDGEFNIEFDYRYDTEGFFSDAMKAALELAANEWAKRIKTDFDVWPKDTIIQLRNLTGGNDPWMYHTVENDIDDIRIFLGSYNRTNENDLLAVTDGSKAVDPDNSNNETIELVSQRMYCRERTVPWAATIIFARDVDWWIDPTPADPFDQYRPDGTRDFINSAIHEIGHALGISDNRVSFQRWLTDRGDRTYFHGPETIKATNTQLEFNRASQHFPYSRDYYSVMSEIISLERHMPSVVDLAILRDLGYKTIECEPSEYIVHTPTGELTNFCTIP